MILFIKNLQNQKNQSKKKVKILKNTIKLLNGRQKVLSVFAKGIFPKGKDVQVF